MRWLLPFPCANAGRASVAARDAVVDAREGRMATSKQKSKFTKRIARPPRGIKQALKAPHSTKTSAARSKRKATAQTVSAQANGSSPSKQDTVLSLLRQAKGT